LSIILRRSVNFFRRETPKPRARTVGKACFAQFSVENGHFTVEDCGSLPPMLTGKQRHYLRGLGHHLDPVVHVGKDGLTEGLTQALDAALAQHELIKVRLGESAGPTGSGRHDIAAALGESVSAELVQVLGRTLLLYRARPDEPAIVLP
jgi:RNA-binding protein